MKTYTVSWLENLNINETLAPLFMNRVSIIKSEDDICEGCEIAYPIYNPAWASCYKMHRNVKLHVLETSTWNRGAKIWKAQNEDENTIILVLFLPKGISLTRYYNKKGSVTIDPERHFSELNG